MKLSDILEERLDIRAREFIFGKAEENGYSRDNNKNYYNAFHSDLQINMNGEIFYLNNIYYNYPGRQEIT